MHEEPTTPEGSDGIEVDEALREIGRVQERVRARRWWYVAYALVAGCTLTTFYVAMASSRDLVDRWIVPGAVLVVAILVVLHWCGRSVPTSAKALENKVTAISVGLALVSMVASRALLTEGFSIWHVAVGVLPGLPWAVLAWRVVRA